MKNFNEKLAEYISQNFNSKKEFSEKLKVDRQSVIYFSSLTNPRNPTFDFLLKFIEHDPSIDLNYFLKNFVESPAKFTKVNNVSELNEKGENYNENNISLLEEIKAQNEKILKLLEK